MAPLRRSIHYIRTESRVRTIQPKTRKRYLHGPLETSLNKQLQMNVELIYALFKLDDLYPERLPEIAIQLLEEGFDNESLLQLAALNNPNKEEVTELVETGIYPLLQYEVDSIRLERVIAKAILDEEITPYRGASLLANSLYGQDGYEFLEKFHHLLIEYDDYEDDIYLNQYGYREGDYKKWLQEVIEDIIKESQKLVNGK